jgi:hypothetical protein
VAYVNWSWPPPAGALPHVPAKLSLCFKSGRLVALKRKMNLLSGELTMPLMVETVPSGVVKVRSWVAFRFHLPRSSKEKGLSSSG